MVWRSKPAPPDTSLQAACGLGKGEPPWIDLARPHASLGVNDKSSDATNRRHGGQGKASDRVAGAVKADNPGDQLLYMVIPL
jgi:hypothetical protein